MSVMASAERFRILGTTRRVGHITAKHGAGFGSIAALCGIVQPLSEVTTATEKNPVCGSCVRIARLIAKRLDTIPHAIGCNGTFPDECKACRYGAPPPKRELTSEECEAHGLGLIDAYFANPPVAVW